MIDGEEIPADSGDFVLKGFDRPCEMSVPIRLGGRGNSTRAPSLVSSTGVDKDNLEELITNAKEKENEKVSSCT